MFVSFWRHFDDFRGHCGQGGCLNIHKDPCSIKKSKSSAGVTFCKRFFDQNGVQRRSRMRSWGVDFWGYTGDIKRTPAGVPRSVPRGPWVIWEPFVDACIFVKILQKIMNFCLSVDQCVEPLIIFNDSQLANKTEIVNDLRSSGSNRPEESFHVSFWSTSWTSFFYYLPVLLPWILKSTLCSTLSVWQWMLIASGFQC